MDELTPQSIPPPPQDLMTLLATLGQGQAPSNSAAPMGSLPATTAAPVSPVPVAPPAAAAPAAPGMDWRALLRLVGPIIGGLTAHSTAAQTGFLNGWQEVQDAQQRENDRKALEAQKRKDAGARYTMDAMNQLDQYNDPVQFAQHLEAFKHGGAAAGFDVSGLDGVQFPQNKIAEAKLRELNDQLSGLEKQGYNLDELSQAGSHVQLKDGTQVPMATAIDLTRKRPTDASGAPIPVPSKLDTGATDFGRFLVKFAKDKGKRVADLTSADELAAKAAYGQAGDKPAMGDAYTRFLTRYATEQGTTVDKLTTAQELAARKQFQNADRNPQIDEMNLSLKQLQLETLRQKAKDAASSAADIQPGSKEYKVASDLAEGRLTFQQLRTLYSYSRDVNKKLAIYEKASEINPNFSPAAFEMGYKFASSPKVQAQVASINNVLSGVGDLVKASDAAARSGVTLLNQFVVPGGVAFGGKKYSDFKTAQIAFADELSGALGYGSATDMSREMGFNMTNPSLSPENFRSAVENIIVPFVNRKKASMLGQMGPYAGAAGGPPPPDQPAAPSAPIKVGAFTVRVKP